MAFLVEVFAMLMVFIGLYGIGSPAGLASFVRKWQGQPGIWIGAVSRILFGVALWSSAASSHTPAVFKVLGVISLIAGIALPFIGAEGLNKLISWWSGRSSIFIRGWSAVAMAFGGFLFWATAA